MKKEKISRKGFTLIELLLVIVVVVILAGTIMVSGEESIISAEANNIINNMRILKSAALEWIADYGEYIQPVSIKSAGRQRDLYMITYPYPAVRHGDLENKAKLHIQNVLDKEENGRGTFVKYLKTSHPIYLNRSSTVKDETPLGGDYAIIDASKWVSIQTEQLIKWYVEYTPKNNDKNANKIRKKLASRAEEFGLLKNMSEPYTDDADSVYMEIVDFDKYYGVKNK